MVKEIFMKFGEISKSNSNEYGVKINFENRMSNINEYFYSYIQKGLVYFLFIYFKIK